jgi:hypothetical protein
MNNKIKGYIGSIGDDLPSLIPLFLGIVLFFAVFINTYNVYTQSTSLYNMQDEALRIALILKEEPVIIDHNFFIDVCKKVDTTYNWTAFITDIDLNASKNMPINLQKLKQEKDNEIENQSIAYEKLDEEDDPKQFICGDYNNFLNISEKRTSKIINYMFPLTRQQEVNSTPVKLYVIMWNE